jgi:hypothetical protein
VSIRGFILQAATRTLLFRANCDRPSHSRRSSHSSLRRSCKVLEVGTVSNRTDELVLDQCS